MLSNDKAIALALILGSAAAVLLVWLSPSVALRTLVAGPLILVLPGYSILHALKMRSLDLRTICLSVALSMAIVAIGGLLLNVADALSTAGWVGLLATVTVAASIVSIARDLAAGAETATRHVSIPPLYWGTFALSLAIGLGAVAMARAGAHQQHQYRFTQLWLVAGSGSLQNVATLGIRNAEDVATSYDVALSADGASIGRRSGIVLQPGETWTEELPLNGRLGQVGRLDAKLFKSDEPNSIYRRAWLSRSRANDDTNKDQR